MNSTISVILQERNIVRDFFVEIVLPLDLLSSSFRRSFITFPLTFVSEYLKYDHAPMQGRSCGIIRELLAGSAPVIGLDIVFLVISTPPVTTSGLLPRLPATHSQPSWVMFMRPQVVPSSPMPR